MSTLQATIRTKADKPNNLRMEGKIPAVFYGSGEESTPITINALDFIRLYREIGETGVIKLTTEKGDYDVMVYDYQLHPVAHEVSHVDFRVVDLKVAIEVAIPLEFEGEAPAVKAGLGTVTHVAQEINVKGLPNKIPSEIVVNVTPLEDLDSQILAKDLNIPADLELVDEPDTVIAVVAAMRGDDDAETSGDIDMDAIEASGEKGSKEEESDESGDE